jgi:SPP1 family predicted phage head-tail adaptor
MINAGEYNHKIKIVKVIKTKDTAGFPVEAQAVVLEPWAKVKTTRGFTLIAQGSDFEKAYTNFTIRYPVTPIDRDMLILFRGKTYEIQYLNNINEACIELEIQAKEVTH